MSQRLLSNPFLWVICHRKAGLLFLCQKNKVLIAQQRINPADVNHLDLDYSTNIVKETENQKKERCHLFPTLKVSSAFIAMTNSLTTKHLRAFWDVSCLRCIR